VKELKGNERNGILALIIAFYRFFVNNLSIQNFAMPPEILFFGKFEIRQDQLYGLTPAEIVRLSLC